MTAATADERSPLSAQTWSSAAPPSFPLADRRPVVLADDPCEASFSGADPEYAGIYLHARYFDPKLGTFLSPDPIGVDGGMNAYGYGFGDPINSADRSGLSPDGPPGVPWWLWWGLSKIFGGGSDVVDPIPGNRYGQFPFWAQRTGSAVPRTTSPTPTEYWPGKHIDPDADDPFASDPAAEAPVVPPVQPPVEPPGGGGGGRRPGSVGAPSTFEYMVPFWGSGRAAIDNFQNDEWVEGCLNTALAVSDVCLVKSVVTGLAKGGLKLSGSHTWRATRSWYGRSRKLPPRTPVHHWLIEQGSATGRAVPLAIINQPYNFLPTANQAFHNAVHAFGPWSLGRVWYGTPGWAKAAWFSSAGRGSSQLMDYWDSEAWN